MPQAKESIQHTEDPVSVLVVDDDTGTRLLCRKFLEREGHLVREAGDGIEGLEMTEEAAPDVIIRDALMSEMDGLTSTRTLKANPATQHIPVILARSRSDATDIVAGMEAGADEYLTKPLNPRELTLRVKTMVASDGNSGEARRCAESSPVR